MFGVGIQETFLLSYIFPCDHIWLFMLAVVLIHGQKTRKAKTVCVCFTIAIIKINTDYYF